MIFVPRPHQVEGIEFMVKNSFAGLFWDPGRGKTPTTLEAFQILRDTKFVRRMLVAASVNIMYDVWPEQIEKFDDLDLTYSIVHGNERQRMDAMDLDADVYLTNYENIAWLCTKYGRHHGLDMLTIDESSKFRNMHTQRFATLRRVLPSFKRRYILTGSPAPKGYLNLWSQMYIVDLGETLGDGITKYKNEYFKPAGYKGYDWVLKDDSKERIHEKLKRRIHRSERDMSVPIEFVDLPVRLPPKAMQMYRELEREFIAQWRGNNIVAANAAVATGKLRQAANGCIYYEDEKRAERRVAVVHDRKIAKLEELCSDLKERGESVLVAYEFDHDYTAMLKAGIEMPSYSEASRGKERTNLKNEWNAGKLPALCGQIQSLSHGLNMQYGGHRGAYFGLPWSLDDYEQFYQRLWRDDQRHGVTMYRLIAEDTIDEVMIETLNTLDYDQQTLLKALKKRYKL